MIMTTSASSASGTMGGNMAAGCSPPATPSTASTRPRTRRRASSSDGLQWRDTPREVAEAADVIFTSVPDDDVLESVASGPDGILAGLAAGKVWVDMSTVSPHASRELAERVKALGARPCSTRRSRAAFPRCRAGR